MAKKRLIFVLFVCLLIMVFGVQSLSQMRRSNRPVRQPSRESRSNKAIEQELKESQKRLSEIKKEFTYQRYALGVTDEQWKVIKPKIEKVQQLRQQGELGASVLLVGSSTSVENGGGRTDRTRYMDNGNPSQRSWQWNKLWEGKTPSGLTEGERIADELIKLVEAKSPDFEQVKLKMEALRKYKQQAEKELPKAQQELRNGLTVRQEAALVLMRYL